MYIYIYATYMYIGCIICIRIKTAEISMISLPNTNSENSMPQRHSHWIPTASGFHRFDADIFRGDLKRCNLTHAQMDFLKVSYLLWLDRWMIMILESPKCLAIVVFVWSVDVSKSETNIGPWPSNWPLEVFALCRAPEAALGNLQKETGAGVQHGPQAWLGWSHITPSNPFNSATWA